MAHKKSKHCSKCFILKDFSLFANDKHKKSGLTSSCRECRSLATNRWRKENPEKDKAYKKSDPGRSAAKKGFAKWKKNNPQKYFYNNKSSCRRYYNNNKEKFVISRKKWRDNNPEKQKYLWRFYRSKRRAAIFNATPKWCNVYEIRNIYQRCPEGFHVDHIIPLNNPLVCGLHVPWNLQYLPANENISKSNKFNVHSTPNFVSYTHEA